MTVHIFRWPGHRDVDPPLWIWCSRLVLQMLNCVYWFYSVPQCHKQRCAFIPFPGFFVGATSATTAFVSPANCHQPETRAVGHPCNPLVQVQQQLSQYLHVLHTQPSSRPFWLMAKSVTSVNLAKGNLIEFADTVSKHKLGIWPQDAKYTLVVWTHKVIQWIEVCHPMLSTITDPLLQTVKVHVQRITMWWGA